MLHIDVALPLFASPVTTKAHVFFIAVLQCGIFVVVSITEVDAYSRLSSIPGLSTVVELFELVELLFGRTSDDAFVD